MTIFKADDKVYCPMLGTEVYTLEERINTTLPISIKENIYTSLNFTNTGKYYSGMGLSSLFHATPENREKLEALYGVKFEKPKRKLKGSELCKYLLKTKHHVFCLVSNTCEADAIGDDVVRCITSYDPYEDYGFSGLDHLGYSYAYAVPIDPETLKPLEMEMDDE